MIPPTVPTTSLTVRKRLACPPAFAFRAWTEPAMFQQWFIAKPGMQVSATMDVRVGGKYRIRFDKGCDVDTVGGEFLVVDPPHRLEYTWVWEDPEKPADYAHTVVKIDFNAVEGNQTELVLTHERFADETARDGHLRGWTSILDHMAAAMAAASAQK